MYKNACPACKNACLLICIFWHLFVLLQYVKTYTEHLTKQDNPMTHIALNMIQTAGLGALALIVGMAMTRRVTLLQRFCVPSPVSGGNICLSMFLGMAMISLKLWELQTLALPLLVILLTQVLLMGVFVYWVAFPLLGRDYDAAVLCAGMCGFGLGATPNAMANMSAVCYKYRYSVKPFLIVPIIGAMFADLINTGIITLFLNVI